MYSRESGLKESSPCCRDCPVDTPQQRGLLRVAMQRAVHVKDMPHPSFNLGCELNTYTDYGPDYFKGSSGISVDGHVLVV